jgi:hypothetical protein
MTKSHELFFIKCKKNKFAFLVLFFGLTISFFSCGQVKKNKSHQDIPESGIENGRRLTALYCQSCHLLPDPSLLDKNTWENGVLPGMGPRLGIFSYGFQIYPSNRQDRHLPESYYPDKAVVNYPEWQNIIDYYKAFSPDSLPDQQRSQTIKTNLSVFKVQVPRYTYPSPAICLTKIDTASSPRQLLLFDLTGKYIFRYDHRLLLTDSVRTDAVITDLDLRDQKMLACNINVINPNNEKFGKAQYLYEDSKSRLQLDTVAVFDSLARPVQITACDLNNDTRTDYLVCEFGHLTGALSWMENTPEGNYIHHVLRPEPGAIKAYIEDVNQDGLPDIWVLFAHGDEGIFLFTNKGNGVFEQRPVLRFPAIYGSTYFEFADFNKDGLQDIVYTCGDNADYSMVLKPYHGVYIFLNEGNNHFKQRYFFPINGCYKAMARDYDRDGDLDIAAISFFADYAIQPEESFVYLENEGGLRFNPFTIPEAKKGRWLTMDVGDLDGDNKTDIVLGNFSVRPSVIPSRVDWQKGPSFIFLKNISK